MAIAHFAVKRRVERVQAADRRAQLTIIAHQNPEQIARNVLLFVQKIG